MEEGKVADPKDGFSRGVEGCTEVEEVEVGRIDRMDVLALTAALPTRWYVTSRNERGLERMGLEIHILQLRYDNHS